MATGLHDPSRRAIGSAHNDAVVSQHFVELGHRTRGPRRANRTGPSACSAWICAYLRL